MVSAFSEEKCLKKLEMDRSRCISVNIVTTIGVELGE